MNNALKVGAALIALTMMSGCDRAATGQSVAVVNGEEISRGELNAEVQRANVGEGPQADQVRAQLLQRVIDRRLLAQKAVEDGVERTPEYVVNERLAREQLLIDLLSRRVAESIPAPTPEQLSRFMAENPAMFAERATLTLDQIQFARPADLTILDELRDDHTLEEVVATLNRLGVPHQAGRSRVDTVNLQPQAFQQITRLPAGEPFIVPTPGGFVVSVVRERQPAPATEDARRLATEAWRQQQQQQRLEAQLRELRQRASIEYQPGFAPPAAGNEQATNEQAARR